MVYSVRLSRGVWEKKSTGQWVFHVEPDGQNCSVLIGEAETYAEAMRKVREGLNVPLPDPVALTYEWPDWMVVPTQWENEPMDIETDGDVSMFMALRVESEAEAICVTTGKENVDMYHMSRRGTCGGRRVLDSVTGLTMEEGKDGEADRGGSRGMDIENEVGLVTPTTTTQLMGGEGLFTDEEMQYLDSINLDEEYGKRNESPSMSIDDTMVAWSGYSDEVGHGRKDRMLEVTMSVARELTFEDEGGISLWDKLEVMTQGTQNEQGRVVRPDKGKSIATDVTKKDKKGREAAVATSRKPGALIIREPGEGAVVGSGALETETVFVGELTLWDDLEVTKKGGKGMKGGKGNKPGGPSKCKKGESMDSEDSSGVMPSREPSDGIDSGKGSGSEAGSEDSIYDESYSGEDLFIGRKFRNKAACRRVMSQHALKNKFNLFFKKSTPDKVVVKCVGRTCPWRVFSKRIRRSDTFEIRTMKTSHRCNVDDRRSFHRQASTSVLGHLMSSRYSGSRPGPRPNELRQIVRGDHMVPISYWKAWRSRQIAMEITQGSYAGSYKNLPAYLQHLVKANPGTVVAMETNFVQGVGERFKYAFVALGACVAGWQYMRRVVIIDGTHLKGTYGGCLVTASAQDGNMQIYPIAFGIVDSENNNAWTWFFEKLADIVPDDGSVVFISDRHSSIYTALAKVYPNSGHGACIIHLQRNIRTVFKEKRLSYLVGRAARAYKVSDFDKYFNEIRGTNMECAMYLLDIGLEHWTRSHSTGARYNVMTSNIAESLNAVLREARELPIVSLLEFIRGKLMAWFAERREAANGNATALTAKVNAMVEQNFELSTGYGVFIINKDEFEVRNEKGGAYHVDLKECTCSCLEFQHLHIPCPHAVISAVCNDVPPASLVAPEYMTDTWRAAYAGNVYPVPEYEAGVLSATNVEVEVKPPATRRPAGRPRLRRYFSRGEFQTGEGRRPTVCGRCGGRGHNRATCREAI